MAIEFDPDVNRYRHTSGRHKGKFASDSDVAEYQSGGAVSNDLAAALSKINDRLDGIETSLKRSSSQPKDKPDPKDAWDYFFELKLNRVEKGIKRKLNDVSGDVQESLYINTLGFHLIAPWVCLAILMAAQLVKGASPTDWAKIILHAILPVSGLVPMHDSKLDELPLQEGDEIIDTSVVQQGQKIGSYAVTSGFGLRSSPGGIGSTNHQGADVALPVGTAIKMPMSGTVECHSESEGNAAGTYAVIKPSGQLYSFLAAHLSQCDPGSHKTGSVFALSGNTGNSTGPHLHWGQKVGGKYIPPQRGYLEMAVVGATARSAGSSNPVIKAIANQESGGDYATTNADSGALGKYQIMPANVPSWSQECLGQQLTAQQFLGSPDHQEKIATCKLTQEFKRARKAGESSFEACRSTASFWYSGSASNKNSSTPQGKYPSILDYTIQVCSKVEKQKVASVSHESGYQSVCITNNPAFAQIYAGYEIGSGSVISSDGLIVTNHHVVKEAIADRKNKIYIRLASGQNFQGTVVAFNQLRDLAIVKVVTAQSLAVVSLAAKAVQPNEKVCSIGNPANKAKINQGYILGLRGADIKAKIALRYGNSGGPLFNQQGEMIGVNKSAWLNENGGFSNVSFATPSNEVIALVQKNGLDLR
ncbi:MAG: trypsin-like peptidase domain-containing protein [Lyngbya sp. HA4199-MV5]|jgi:S1-C subfamily serine protease|nr:trypsin-like peptidase domain-containing protein [Lyngbya sp. HA4199-MV5]